MASSLNKNSINGDNIVSVIYSDNFKEYEPELQKQILNKIDEINKRDGGFMGRFFGTKKEIASMNIAFTLCIALILICLFDIVYASFTNGDIHMNLINIVIPVITLSIGFIFGKSGDGKQNN